MDLYKNTWTFLTCICLCNNTYVTNKGLLQYMDSNNVLICVVVNWHKTGLIKLVTCVLCYIAWYLSGDMYKFVLHWRDLCVITYRATCYHITLTFYFICYRAKNDWLDFKECNKNTSLLNLIKRIIYFSLALFIHGGIPCLYVIALGTFLAFSKIMFTAEPWISWQAMKRSASNFENLRTCLNHHTDLENY